MKKITAPHVFDGERFLRENTLLIVDEKGMIVDIQENETTPDEHTLVFEEGIICPGFINAHCHLELSHLRKHIPPLMGMIGFIKEVISRPTPKEEDVLRSIREADARMWENGIQAVGDIANTNKTAKIKQSSSIYYHTFIELLDRGTDELFFQNIRSLKKEFEGLPHSIVPHAPYSVAPAQFERIARWSLPAEPLSIHYNESAEEKIFLQGRGGQFDHFFKTIGRGRKIERMPYNAFFNVFYPQTKLMLVHNTEIDVSDIDLIRKHIERGLDISFCICPLSNRYIHDRLPPLYLLAQSAIPISVGTDSLASNEGLSILDELVFLQKNFPDISVRKLLSLATSGGAIALAIEGLYGKIERKKSPGLIHISHASPAALSDKSAACRIV